MNPSIVIYEDYQQKKPVTIEYIDSRTVSTESTRKRGKSTQERLANRYWLVPDIDLKKNKCIALIDWIEIRVCLEKQTQHQWIGDEIEGITNRRPHVVPLDPGPGDVSTTFDFTIQEPDFRKLLAIGDRLKEKWGVKSTPKIRRFELSIDFYPHSRKHEDYARLHGFLTRQLYVDPRNFEDSDWPRFYPGTKGDNTSMTIVHSSAWKSISEKQAEYTRRREQASSPYYGSTFYIGRQDHPDKSWRVMIKILDTQHHGAKTRRTLTAEEKRVRVEATFGPDGVAGLGIETIEDFGSGKLTKDLATSSLPFRLATFSSGGTSTGRSTANVEAFAEPQRLDTFLKCGATSLRLSDMARREIRIIHRTVLKEKVEKDGAKLKPMSQTGEGQNGNFVSWVELNQKVQAAVKSLNKKLANAIKKGSI